MPGLLIALVVSAVVLVLMRPTTAAATSVVRRWAPGLDPTPDRVAVVWRHLVRRRLPLVIGGPLPIPAGTSFDDVGSLFVVPQRAWFAIVGALVTAALTATTVRLATTRRLSVTPTSTSPCGFGRRASPWASASRSPGRFSPPRPRPRRT